MGQGTRFQKLFELLMTWMILQLLLRFLGLVFTACTVAAAGLVCTTIYGLRFEPIRMAKLYQRNVYRQWIQLVCRLARMQVPTELAVDGESHCLQLKSDEDYRWALDRLKSRVRGHDESLEAVMNVIQKSVLLRSRTKHDAALPPIGTFIVSGPAGIGKRLIAEQVGQHLYRRPATTVIDLSRFNDADGVGRLFGTSGIEGVLTQAVRRCPGQTVILENLQEARAELIRQLRSLLMTGQCVDGANRQEVRFRDCVVFLLATTSEPTGGEGAMSNEQKRHWFDTSCPIATPLLAICSEYLQLTTPSAREKAAIIAQLMIEECLRYQIELEYVAPEILVDEVDLFSSRNGFEQTCLRLSRWMSGPLHLAVTNGMQRLALTSEVIARCQVQDRRNDSNENRHELLAAKAG